MNNLLINANALSIPLADGCVNCVVTSPPYYGLRDYGVYGQLGAEPTSEQYVENMVRVFREVWRVLRNDGTLWLNIGDSYAGSGKGLMGDGTHSDSTGVKQGTNTGSVTGNLKPWRQGSARADGEVRDDGESRRNRNGVGPVNGCKPKDLIGIPWMVAFALRADGWYLRSDIIWHKPNPMPESVTDRPTKSHEYLFLLTKQARYYYERGAIAESSVYPGDDRSQCKDTRKEIDPMCQDKGSREKTGNPAGETRNARTVWTIPTQPTKEAHFATYPEKLVEPCILAGCPVVGVVFDPFTGSGTTGRVAIKNGRNFVGTELNMMYILEIASERTSGLNVRMF